ncbi:solute carrier family 35 member F2 isoform X3 [Colletes latitarsis]|uniref:solute carrier family 35 member F2 isoform X3 n=1 Tax=Colletes latitarsis TaxID=2605962 RepID=UPI004036A0A6
MHHAMGVSTGDRCCGQNTAMQARNGICDKIENYISELGQWYVSAGSSACEEDLGRKPSIRPRTGYTAATRGREGVNSRMKVAGVRDEFSRVLRLPGDMENDNNGTIFVPGDVFHDARKSSHQHLAAAFASDRTKHSALRYDEPCVHNLDVLQRSGERPNFSHKGPRMELLDCVAIPVALALSCLVLGVRYRMVHIVGVSVCLMGVGCLVWAGIDDNKDPASTGKNQLVGDMLCLGGAVLFSVTTVLQELAVKTVDIIEYLGMIGFFGMILSCLQTAVLESLKLESFHWNNAPVITFLVVYCIMQFVFFSLVPVILFESGATALQLALLTADSFNVLSGMLIHEYKFHALYFVSYTLTMTGIYIYAIKRTPMSSNPRRQHIELPAPDYSCPSNNAGIRNVDVPRS